MMPKYRSEILHGVQTMCQLFPSYRFCQMVANYGHLAAGDPGIALKTVIDRDFLEVMRESINQRTERLAGEPAPSHEGETLPALLPEIVRGLEELSEQYPDKPFVPLVLQVAEWTKEFSTFDFWDVEDADFLRAIQAHLSPTEVAP